MKSEIWSAIDLLAVAEMIDTYCIPPMALFQAAAIIKLIDMSTGIISPTNWQLVIAVRNNPLPTPTTKPESHS